MRYVFITVNFNGFNFTKEFIKSVSELSIYDGDNVSIIVVDNNSSDSEKQKLKSYSSSLKIIFSNKNLGYFGGLNLGIDAIDIDANTIVIVSNNDITYDRDFIMNFRKIKYGANTMVIAPNIVTKEGRQQNPHVIYEISAISKIKSKIYFSNYYIGQGLRIANRFIRKIFPKKIINNNYNQMTISMGIGACYILTSNFFREFNYLDAPVFMWGEEAVLRRQVESKNGKTIYSPIVKVLHHEGGSVKKIESKQRYKIGKKSYNVYKRYL